MLTGDLKNDHRVLDWLLIQKDPSGDVIEEIDGDALQKMIDKSSYLAVYFCEYSVDFF